MKKSILALVGLTLFAGSAMAGEYVQGYYRSNGSYVQPYYRSSPDNSYNNNYNVQGNYNPYNGQAGGDTPTWNSRSPESNKKSYGDAGYSGYNSTYSNGNIYRGLR